MDGDMIEHHHQSKYTMWMNRQHVFVPRGRVPPPSSGYDHCYESWEERAFAEDAARGLGGFIWPPRSYTCSFCRREFKSAQALGGHMNVHRRDRARLKHALSPRRNETNLMEQQQQHADSSLHQTTVTLQTSEDSPNEGFVETQELHVNTKLCMGLKLDEVLMTKVNNKCKRLKSSNIILVDPCLVVSHESDIPPLLHHEGDHDVVVDGVKMRLMEELDLELRLGV